MPQMGPISVATLSTTATIVAPIECSNPNRRIQRPINKPFSRPTLNVPACVDWSESLVCLAKPCPNGYMLWLATFPLSTVPWLPPNTAISSNLTKSGPLSEKSERNAGCGSRCANEHVKWLPLSLATAARKPVFAYGAKSPKHTRRV